MIRFRQSLLIPSFPLRSIHSAKQIHKQQAMSPVSPKSPQKSNHVKDPVRVAAGYKATLHNSKASDLAHEHAQQMLNQIEHKNDLTEVSAQGQKEHLVHVLAGHKATLASSRTSEEAKARSRQVLKDAGETV